MIRPNCEGNDRLDGAGPVAQAFLVRLTSLVYQFYGVGWQAIPIVALITFLIGAIIAQ